MERNRVELVRLTLIWNGTIRGIEHVLHVSLESPILSQHDVQIERAEVRHGKDSGPCRREVCSLVELGAHSLQIRVDEWKPIPLSCWYKTIDQKETLLIILDNQSVLLEVRQPIFYPIESIHRFSNDIR